MKKGIPIVPESVTEVNASRHVFINWTENEVMEWIKRLNISRLV